MSNPGVGVWQCSATAQNWTDNRNCAYEERMRRFCHALVGVTLLGCEPSAPDVLREYPPPRRVGTPVDSPGATSFHAVLGGHVNVEVKLGGQARKLRLSVKEGQLQLDAARLAGARGSLLFDLHEVQIAGCSQEERIALKGALGLLGADRTTSATARFDFWELSRLSEVRVRERRGDDADAVTRVVDATVRGHLELGGVRTEQQLRTRLELTFDGALPMGVPRSVLATSRGPHPLALTRHGIHLQRAARRAGAEVSGTAVLPRLSPTARLRFQLEFKTSAVPTKGPAPHGISPSALGLFGAD